MKSSYSHPITVEVKGLSVNFVGHTEEEVSAIKGRYFSYHQDEFDPRKKRKVKKSRTLDLIHFGSINYLKNINPEFASRVKIVGFDSVKSWRPLDLSRLSDIDLGLLDLPGWRNSQLDVLRSCYNKVISNVVAGMGLGKTLIIIALAHLSSLQGRNVVITAPTDKIRSTILEKAKQLGLRNFLEYGELRGNYSGQTGLVIVVNSQPLLNDFSFDTPAMAEFKASVSTLITDESHNWTRDGWNQLLLHFSSLHRLVGLSATSVPEHEEGLSYGHISHKTVFTLNACGSVTYRVPREEVEEHTDVPEIVEVRYVWDQLRYARYSSTRSWKVLKELMYGNRDRNKFILLLVRLMQAYGRNTILPVNDKDQAMRLMTELGSDKVVCWFGKKIGTFDIRGKVNPDTIERRFNSGEYNTIFASSHIKEGFDLPKLDTIILQEGKDDIFAQQSSGRIIRKSDQKSLVVNVADDFYLFETHAKHREHHITRYYNRTSTRFSSVKQLAAYVQELNGKNSLQ